MKYPLLATCLLLASALLVQAETVHQTALGSAAYKGDGGNAVKGGLMETKTVKDVPVARVTPSMKQWGFVTYWMGLRTPAGDSTIRIRVLNTEETTADYAVYLSGGPNEPFGRLTIPAGTPADEFVDIDIPVSSDKEWSGIVLKKTTTESLPGPWIESVSVLLK